MVALSALRARLQMADNPRTSMRALAGILWVAALFGSTLVRSENLEHDHPEPAVLAPGYYDLTFAAPAAGSYALPGLGHAADGEVLLDSGKSVRLHDLYADRVVVLSFIYTSCGDVNGCPLATHVLARVQERLARAADLAAKVRLVSLSFDPERDSPDVMRAYGARFQHADVDWRFVTSADSRSLAPLLDDYDQSVIQEIDAQGRPLGTLSHILRVYLIDSRGEIRNIYSVSFLHADTLLNDIRTLLGESDRRLP